MNVKDLSKNKLNQAKQRIVDVFNKEGADPCYTAREIVNCIGGTVDNYRRHLKFLEANNYVESVNVLTRHEGDGARQRGASLSKLFFLPKNRDIVLKAVNNENR